MDCLKRWQSDLTWHSPHRACYKKWKVEWETQTGMCRWSTSTFVNSCGCTALDMPEWRETTEQTDWRKQPLQVACFSEDLKCWEAWDTTCGHKAKDFTPSIAWRRDAWKEEAPDDLLSKDERGPSSIRRTLDRFKGNCGETSEKRGGAHNTGFSERRDTYYWTELNWTERNSAENPPRRSM